MSCRGALRNKTAMYACYKCVENHFEIGDKLQAACMMIALVFAGNSTFNKVLSFLLAFFLALALSIFEQEHEHD